MVDAVVPLNQTFGAPSAPSQAVQWNVSYYVKALALGILIYFVAIHLWAWVLMFVAPIIDSYFPSHTYLVPFAVAALLCAIAVPKKLTVRGVCKNSRLRRFQWERTGVIMRQPIMSYFETERM